MFCTKCGTEYASNANFCPNCGARGDIGATPGMVSPAGSPSAEPMTFGKSISVCMSKYADFDGRASRSEYWWFYLFVTLIGWGAALVHRSDYLATLIELAFALPIFAAGARRLHDTNRSGWWQLIILTIIGVIPLIMWLASEGEKGENEFGKPL